MPGVHGIPKRRPGDGIALPAEAINALLDVARAHREGELAPPEGGFEPPASGLVLIQNQTGSALLANQVVGLDDAIIPPSSDDAIATFRQVIGLKGVVPTADHKALFAVLLEPLLPGAIGVGAAAGAVPVMVNVSDETHEAADVAEGIVGHLQSQASGGAKVLWRQPGTGLVWAVVRLGDGSNASAPADPYLLLPAAGDFETEEAQTDIWARDDPPAGKVGVQFQVMQTRMAYNDAGDEKLYAFRRVLTFDADGRLSNVSAEIRVEVDVPDECA